MPTFFTSEKKAPKMAKFFNFLPYVQRASITILDILISCNIHLKWIFEICAEKG